jgi:hypothetical protein
MFDWPLIHGSLAVSAVADEHRCGHDPVPVIALLLLNLTGARRAAPTIDQSAADPSDFLPESAALPNPVTAAMAIECLARAPFNARSICFGNLTGAEVDAVAAALQREPHHHQVRELSLQLTGPSQPAALAGLAAALLGARSLRVLTVACDQAGWNVPVLWTASASLRSVWVSSNANADTMDLSSLQQLRRCSMGGTLRWGGENLVLGSIVFAGALRRIGCVCAFPALAVLDLSHCAALRRLDGGFAAGCNNLHTLRLPDCLADIGDHFAARATALRGVALPRKLLRLGHNALSQSHYNAACADVDISGCTELVSVGRRFMAGSNISGRLEMPQQAVLTRISSYFMLLCRHVVDVDLRSLSGLTAIDEEFCSKCMCLVSVALPDSVTSIGSYFLADSGAVRHAPAPRALVSIGRWAFRGCRCVRDIDWGACAALERIGDHFARQCTALTAVQLPAQRIALGDCALMQSENVTRFTGGELPTHTDDSGRVTIDATSATMHDVEDWF